MSGVYTPAYSTMLAKANEAAKAFTPYNNITGRTLINIVGGGFEGGREGGRDVGRWVGSVDRLESYVGLLHQ